MLEVLDANLLTEDKIKSNDLFDKAAKCRKEIPTDIKDLIRTNPDEWNNIRTVLKEMLLNERRNFCTLVCCGLYNNAD